MATNIQPNIISDSSGMIGWYKALSHADKDILLAKLLELDTKYKLDYDSAYVTAVRQGMECILDNMVKYVKDKLGPGYYDVELELVKTGSFYSHTRVGEPSEFDFALTCKLPKNKRTTVKHLIRRLWDLCIEGMESNNLPSSADGRWNHGGCNAPLYSGYRKNGPATMFQFIYDDSEHEHPKLYITVDLVIVILKDLKEPVSRSGYKRYIEQQWEIYYRIPENMSRPVSSPSIIYWWRRFDRNHPVKMIMRLLKIMNRNGDLSHSDIKHNQREETYVNELLNRDTTSERRKSLLQEKKVSVLCRISLCRGGRDFLGQLNEIYPQLKFFSSYLLQVIIMELYEASVEDEEEEEEEKWTVQNMPELLITILDILHFRYSTVKHNSAEYEACDTRFHPFVPPSGANTMAHGSSRTFAYIKVMLESILQRVPRTRFVLREDISDCNGPNNIIYRCLVT